MSENKCPDCGLDLENKNWFTFESHDLLCHACKTSYSLLGLARYVEEQKVGETTAHNLQLSYPYICRCGYKHQIISVLCHPIDVTSQFGGMKKEVPNDPISENSG